MLEDNYEKAKEAYDSGLRPEETEFLVTCTRTKELITTQEICVVATSFYEAIEIAKSGEAPNWWGEEEVQDDSIVVDESYKAEVNK